MRRVVIRVYGRVQGVGFRAWTVARARELAISGYVMNEPDGTVLIEAEGSEEALKRLVELCHRGPPAAIVERVDVSWVEPRGDLKGFRIRK